ncbi:uncharacterized protein LOC128390502 [Panonychus citri]|uniref:uncharacterized protein LOC128390502 n=1 Tax=Panonychus citri TaxID=50023 RepID=UPI0023071927|nr:uncharacterized protein LOC128390502 [Panonychus citri]
MEQDNNKYDTVDDFILSTILHDVPLLVHKIEKFHNLDTAAAYEKLKQEFVLIVRSEDEFGRRLHDAVFDADVVKEGKDFVKAYENCVLEQKKLLDDFNSIKLALNTIKIEREEIVSDMKNNFSQKLEIIENEKKSFVQKLIELLKLYNMVLDRNVSEENYTQTGESINVLLRSLKNEDLENLFTNINHNINYLHCSLRSQTQPCYQACVSMDTQTSKDQTKVDAATSTSAEFIIGKVVLEKKIEELRTTLGVCEKKRDKIMKNYSEKTTKLATAEVEIETLRKQLKECEENKIKTQSQKVVNKSVATETVILPVQKEFNGKNIECYESKQNYDPQKSIEDNLRGKDEKGKKILIEQLILAFNKIFEYEKLEIRHINVNTTDIVTKVEIYREILANIDTDALPLLHVSQNAIKNIITLGYLKSLIESNEEAEKEGFSLSSQDKQYITKMNLILNKRLEQIKNIDAGYSAHTDDTQDTLVKLSIYSSFYRMLENNYINSTGVASKLTRVSTNSIENQTKQIAVIDAYSQTEIQQKTGGKVEEKGQANQSIPRIRQPNEKRKATDYTELTLQKSKQTKKDDLVNPNNVDDELQKAIDSITTSQEDVEFEIDKNESIEF